MELAPTPDEGTTLTPTPKPNFQNWVYDKIISWTALPKDFKLYIAEGFPTLHGDPQFSKTTFDNTDRTFSVYSFTNKKTKKRIKNPDKSWFRIENRNSLRNDSSVLSLMKWVKKYTPAAQSYFYWNLLATLIMKQNRQFLEYTIHKSTSQPFLASYSCL